MSPTSSRLRVLADAVLSSRYTVATSSVLFFVILGTAFLLVYQNAGFMRDQINDDFNQQQLILARQAASQIDASLQDIQVEIDSLKRHHQGMSAAVWDDEMGAVLERTESKGLVEIGLLGADGRVVAWHHLATVQPTRPARVQNECGQSGRTQMSLGPVEASASGSEQHLVISTLCTDMSGIDPEDGVLFATLNVSRLVSRATRDIRSGKTGYAWAIDQAGTFLYHPEAEFISRNAFLARQERQPYISFTQINQIMKERMLQGAEGTGTYVSGWHRGVSGQITKLIAYTPVQSALLRSDHTWSVAVVAPISEVAETVNRVYVRHFVAEAALIVGVFVFGVLGAIYQRRLSLALEKRMSQQEEYMLSILQNSMDAIMFVDNDNHVQVWNRGAERIFGYTAAEMVGQTFHRLIPPEIDAEEELQRIQLEAQTKGYIRDYIASRLTKDGSRVTVDLSRTVVRSKDGEVMGSTVIIKDVTEKTQWEQRIYNTEKLASIGNLAAGVAHEINNPLAVISGFTDLLMERFAPGAPEFEDLKIIAENANNAKKIVEDLLGFARVSEGLEDTVDIAHGISRVVSIVRNTLMTAKIELVVEVPPTLPRVRGDAREFQQVIFNLINNSVAAMRETGGRLTLSARADQESVHVSVADTGTGIPDKIKRQIFDPFFTTKKVGEGTGLGLSLCYGIVSKYGGKMSFESVSPEDSPDKPSGTTFTVSMPVCEWVE